MTKHDRQRWLVAISLFIALFILWGGGYNTSPVFLAALIKANGWGHEETALIPSVLALAVGITAPIAGWLLDRLEARIVMAVGGLLALAGFIIAGRSHTLEALVVANIVLGIGLGSCTWLPASMVVANWFGENRGTALGICTAGMESGGMAMTILLGYVIAHGTWRIAGISLIGWRAAYLLLAIPTLLVALPLFVFVVRTRPRNESQLIRQTVGDLPGLEVRQALATRALWMLVIVQLMYGLAVGGIFIHLIAYLRGVGYTEQIAALAVGLTLGIAAIGKPSFGFFGDHIGGKNALAIAFFLNAVGILILLGARQELLLVIGLFVLGFSGAVPVALVPMVLAETLGLKRFGTIFGTLGLVVTIGLFFGPLISGRLFDITGSYSRGFEICVLLNLVATAASFACVAPRAVREPLLAGAANAPHPAA
jgi:OFA family oxalate/formate antiporter-like MFS transporter